MTNGKISRKIKRLELLGTILDVLENEIESHTSTLEDYKNQLIESNKEDSNPWDIEYIQQRIEEYTIILDEAKKLKTELEKTI